MRRIAALVVALALVVASCSTTRESMGRPDPNVVQASSRSLSAEALRAVRQLGTVVTTSTTAGSRVAGSTALDQAGEIEAEFLALTNADRAVVGAAPLVREPGLDAYARGVAARLAATGQLTHSRIEDLLGAWWFVGENIGVGPSALAIQGAYRASAGHFRNLTHEDFTNIGIGVSVDAAGRIWTAQDFAA